MTDYKQLCAELLEAWDTAPTPSDFIDTNGYGTIQKIRAALAKSESSGDVTGGKHPITPPSEELVEQWGFECESEMNAAMYIATQAARWGADQELLSCCEWFSKNYGIPSSQLRAARRPKPLSLKEQALALLDDVSDRLDAVHENAIRRALESLPE